jgi:signal transduction histidine kinase
MGFGLSASAAAAAAAAAWSLHKFHHAGASPEFRLLGGVAFVLRDALSTLRGFAELLVQGKGKPPDGPDPGEACRFILNASEDLARFAQNLQDFACFEQGRMTLREQQVDAAELVHAALASFERMAENADVVIIAPLANGVELQCDPHRIRRAVANLVSWSIRAAPAGSNIWVRAERDPVDALAITVTNAAPFPGMDATGNLFEPQLEIQGLNGLALPIARRMALLHSGEVTITGDADAGTMLRLTLPAGRVTWPNVAETQAPRAA